MKNLLLLLAIITTSFASAQSTVEKSLGGYQTQESRAQFIVGEVIGYQLVGTLIGQGETPKDAIRIVQWHATKPAFIKAVESYAGLIADGYSINSLKAIDKLPTKDVIRIHPNIEKVAMLALQEYTSQF